MKLICMAPKASAVAAPVNLHPVAGVNTSDRNNTSTEATLAGPRNSQAKGGASPDSQHDAAESTGDAVQTSDMGSQLNTEVASLKLTAPGTSRHDRTVESSE